MDQPNLIEASLLSFNDILMPLLAALGLSVTIERILEFSKNILEHTLKDSFGRALPKKERLDSLIGGIESIHKKDQADLENETRIQELNAKIKNETDSKKVIELEAELEALVNENEIEEAYNKATLLVEPARDPSDGKALKRFILQTLGIAIGIIAAKISEIELFSAFVEGYYGDKLTLDPSIDHILTGILIGGGTAPINTLIRFITKRTISVDKSKVTSEEKKKLSGIEPEQIKIAEVIANVPSGHLKKPMEEWVDIPYAGGVDKDVLEKVHKRWQKDSNGKWQLVDPSMIIYHHTAMDSDSTFEDVVRVIKNRKTKSGKNWVTGYNYVVTYDGIGHPFCRWDRRGNQAAGYNTKSLGITLNGNFEPDPKIPFSNPDGRFGAMKPSEDQMKMAARVITLWTFLYDIELDFENKIIPHNKVSTKTCPGTGFPYKEFKKLITTYHKEWSNSDAIKKRIEEYKLKPYIYS